MILPTFNEFIFIFPNGLCGYFCIYDIFFSSCVCIYVYVCMCVRMCVYVVLFYGSIVLTADMFSLHYLLTIYFASGRHFSGIS